MNRTNEEQENSSWLIVVLLPLVALLLCPSSGYADISWLYAAKNCEELSTGIASHFVPGSEMTELQRSELRLVLFEGCGPRFRHCNLSVCSQAEDLEKEEERPLFWIDRVDSCQEFKELFKAKYSFIREIKNMPDSLANEVDYVLSRACSDSYGPCFKAKCEVLMKRAVVDTKPVEEMPTPNSSVTINSSEALPNSTAVLNSTEVNDLPTVTDDLQQQALLEQRQARQAFEQEMKRYDALVREMNAEQDAIIEMRIVDESKRKVDWSLAANPKEIEELQARREREREEEVVNRNQIPQRGMRGSPVKPRRQLTPSRSAPTSNSPRNTTKTGPMVY